MAAILAFILLFNASPYPKPMIMRTVPPVGRVYVTVHANSVNVPLIPQQTCCWCWAASGQMVMAYFGVTKGIQQCNQAAQQFNVPNCCSTPFPNACISGGQVWISHFGFTSQQTGGTTPLTFAQMQDQIDNKREPWILNPHWPTSGTLTFGHVLVGIGYKTISFVGGVFTDQYVLIDDPWPPNQGNVYYEPYSQYVTGTYLSSPYVDGYDSYDITPPATYRPIPRVSAGIFLETRAPRPLLTPPPAWQGPFGPTPEAAAQNSLPLMAALLDARNYQGMGFDSASPRLALGRPLRVLTAQLEPLRRFERTRALEQVVTESPSFLFPVLSGGAVRAQIQVSRTSRGWEGVAFGQAGLAQMIARFRSELPGDVLIHVPSLNQLFLSRGTGVQQRLTPVYDFEPLKMKAGLALPARETFANMAPAARAYDGQPR